VIARLVNDRSSEIGDTTVFAVLLFELVSVSVSVLPAATVTVFW